MQSNNRSVPLSRPFPTDITVLEEQDILCGSSFINHEGNRAFEKLVRQVVIEFHRQQGNDTAQADKSEAARRLVQLARSKGARFLKEYVHRPNVFYDIGDKRAITKVIKTFFRGEAPMRVVPPRRNSHKERADQNMKIEAREELTQPNSLEASSSSHGDWSLRRLQEELLQLEEAQEPLLPVVNNSSVSSFSISFINDEVVDTEIPSSVQNFQEEGMGGVPRNVIFVSDNAAGVGRLSAWSDHGSSVHHKPDVQTRMMLEQDDEPQQEDYGDMPKLIAITSLDLQDLSSTCSGITSHDDVDHHGATASSYNDTTSCASFNEVCSCDPSEYCSLCTTTTSCNHYDCSCCSACESCSPGDDYSFCCESSDVSHMMVIDAIRETNAPSTAAMDAVSRCSDVWYFNSSFADTASSMSTKFSSSSWEGKLMNASIGSYIAQE